MRIKNPLIFTSLTVALIVPTFGQFVESWQFSDAAETGLGNTSNSGTVGTNWNFNVNGQPGEAATDGLGSLFIGQDLSGNAGTSVVSNADYT